MDNPPPERDDTDQLLHLMTLTEAIELWRTDPHLPDDPDPEPQATLTLTPAGGGLTHEVPLTGRHITDLAAAVRAATARRRTVYERRQRAEAMGRIIAQARRDGLDPGQLVADAAARYAAGQTLPGMGPGRAFNLVAARPASWEAAILWQWTQEGDPQASGEHVDQLVPLLRDMATAGDDGGDVVSLALGAAATELGSVAALADGSAWRAQVRELAGQYAEVDDRWPPD